MREASDALRRAQAHLQKPLAERSGADKRREREERARRAQYARDEKAHAKATQIALGRAYNRAKENTLELNDRIDIMGDPNATADERNQARAEAEEFQAMVDAFWYKHRDSEWFLGHPELEKAQKAWKRSCKTRY